MLAALCLVGLAANTASASLVITLDYEFSGATSPSAPPVVTIANSGVDQVTVTLDLTALQSAEFTSGIYLNFDPAKAGSLGSLSFAHSSGVVASSIAVGANAFKADGNGDYDILFSFPSGPPADRLGGGLTSVYVISGVSGLDESDFNFRSVGSDKGHFLAAAHVQGIGTGGNLSGWVGDQGGAPGTTPIPEPSTLAMALVGLGAFGFVKLRRRNRSLATE